MQIEQADIKSDEFRISKEYRASTDRVVIEHFALSENPAKWRLVVKCRDTAESSPTWIKLHEVFHDADVVETKTDLIVHLNQPKCPTNFVLAAFGTPGRNSNKRMQVIAFSKHLPDEGRVDVHVLLIDDTQYAFEGICARFETQGCKMLAPMAVLFLSADEQADVEVTIKGVRVQSGWSVAGAARAVFSYNQALNSAELDINDIPSHRFIFKNTNTSKSCLSCKIEAVHTRDKAVVDVLKSFKTKQKLVKRVTENSFPGKGKELLLAEKHDVCDLGLGIAQFTAVTYFLSAFLVISVKMAVKFQTFCFLKNIQNAFFPVLEPTE